jgi:RNA polymerase sigma-70 factor (ECF subfamily)
MTFDFDVRHAAAVSGNHDAFAEIYRRTQPVVLRYLRATTSMDADDIAAETWLSVIRDFSTFRGDETDFRAWILTIARHRMIDTGRAAARRPRLASVPLDEVDPPTVQDAAEQALERIGTVAAVDLLSELPADQAEAVALRIVAGLDVARTAELMDRSPGAVRVLTHRGLRTLRERLARSARTQV